MTARTQRLAVLLLASLGFGAGIAAALWSAGLLPGLDGRTVRSELPQITGSFSLVDEQGNTVQWEALGHRLQLVFFGFTHCPEVCPTTLASAVAGIRGLDEDGKALRLLLISVDPERDTPPVLRAYTSAFSPWVLGFTGSAEQVSAAAKAFGVFFEKMPPMGMPDDYMVNHTASLFLLGTDNEILTIIPYGASPEEIGGAIRPYL